jgi:signal transduction histidine kinase/ActR/RegA family two-component response regulator
MTGQPTSETASKTAVDALQQPLSQLQGVDALSSASRAKLLHMTASRYTAEFALIIIPGLLAWLYSRHGDIWRFMPWVIGMALLAIWMLWRRYVYRRDRPSMSNEQLLARFEPESRRVALVYGLSWAMPVLLVCGDTSGTSSARFEFGIALYLVLAGVTAAATNYLASIFDFFIRYFLGIWVIALASVVSVFPQHWQFILPLSVLYSVISFRHALGMHRFLVRQMELEERSNYLAEQYRSAKDEAEKALAAKSQFLTTASHDLRQPVHALGMLLESMRRRNRDASLQPLMQDMDSCVRSVNFMFNSLLDLDKIESGASALQPVWCDMPSLLREIVVIFREDAASRGLQIRLRLDASSKSQGAWVLADPALLRQVMFNLVHNALRYTVHGGVLLALRARGGGWQVDVCDTGVGVAQDEQAQIFSPFYRSHVAWSVDSAGHGLGLSVVARCAQLMQTRYGVRSRLGRGSRFWLRFDVPHSKGSVQSGERLSFMHVSPSLSALADGELPMLQGRCLVIEDDPQVAKAWKSLLQSWGVETCLAAHASKVWAALQEGFVPQVIFCDQRLRSGESGFDLLRELLERYPDARGAMISGEFNSPELQEAEAEGYLVLHKPLDTMQIYAMLQRWLNPAESSAIT